jgi:hypothetical protein
MEKIHPDDVAFRVRTWLENLGSGNPHDAVCRIRGADSAYRWFNIRGEPLRTTDNRTLSWHGVLVDIDGYQVIPGPTSRGSVIWILSSNLLDVCSGYHLGPCLDFGNHTSLELAWGGRPGLVAEHPELVDDSRLREKAGQFRMQPVQHRCR